jgi:hypothetical protein
MYSSTFPLTSALDGVGFQHHAPAALPPGKTRYAWSRRLGGLQGQSGRVRKNSPPPGFDLRTVQPTASRCTNCAVPVNVGRIVSLYIYMELQKFSSLCCLFTLVIDIL